MKFVRDLHAVSEFLFYAGGIVLFAALLFWRNESLPFVAEVILRYGDLPFAFICLLFAGTGLRLSFAAQAQSDEILPDEELENPILDAILILIGLIIFFVLVYVDFALPDIV